ncbi:NACHT C-terminal alpha/beta 1 domain-containing protein [Laspinema palackyanum]|uniref:NACHT C-terminal alpha/beta 1 domain-containing protein n=1 Tax=Laspinema palackyanum TaxID=3231601 RepID=UPI00345DBAB3|nr:NACHT domain-containing protein [Laspinema sp. D2c]
MSEPNHQNIGSQGNQGQQGNVAGDNYGIQKNSSDSYYIDVKIINNNGGPLSQQRQIDRDICRQMLEEQMQLTSNTVIGRVYGNRNLIDEDLFVDLALVKRKSSQKEQHPQDTDRERGLDLSTRQEETVEKPLAYRKFLQEVIGKRTETEKKKIAIIGEPGVGKTTLLQKLAFWLLQETDDLVIWVSLAELGGQSLGEYLEEKWLKEALGQSREEIKADWEQKFKGGAVWLLLDGLDEMSQTDQQALKLRGWVTDARMIVTCRLNLWQANPSQFWAFQTYLTQPFQDEQMQEFIRRWFRGLVEAGEDVKLAKSLWSELQATGKERIKDLCRNPLRLTLLVSIWQGRAGDLPDTMAELYLEFVNYIYKWNEEKNFTPVKDKEREHLNAALGNLAKASLDREGNPFRLTHQLICEYLVELDDNSLLDTALKLGWLNELEVAAKNPHKRVYVFYHATFQEYFAALAVEDWDDFLPRNHVDCPVEGKPYRIFEPQWKQVILLWLGREDIKDKDKDKDKEKEAFIRALVEFQDGVGKFYGYQAYFLAAAGINEFKDCSPCLAAEIVQQVVKWGFGYFNIECREQQTNVPPQITEAAKAIIPQTHRSIVVDSLVDLLASLNEYTRIEVATTLGKIVPGHSKASAALMSLIERSYVPGILMQAVIALARISNNKQEKISLLTSLCNHSNMLVRSIAAQSLHKIEPNHPQAQAVSITIETTSFQESVKSGKFNPGNPQVIESLIDEVRFSDNNNKKLNAVKNLGYTHPEDPEVIIKFLIKLIKEPSTDNKIRNQAIRSLGRIGKNSYEGINFLISLIVNRPQNLEIVQEVVQALQYIELSYQEVINTLLNLICTISDKPIRLGATRSLRKILHRNLLKGAISAKAAILALKNCISVAMNAQQNTDIYLCFYEVLWHCTQILPYPEFYQAWHPPTTIPHPEVTEQNTHNGEQSFGSPLTCKYLEHLPIYCLHAALLANETREGEIALTLSELIWEITCPDEDPPEPATPAKLRRDLSSLKRRNLLPHRAILLAKHHRSDGQTFLEPIQPTPALITFCENLTGVIAIAFLTDEPLDPPLKGFPPNQPNLISAIETWLEEM